MPYTQERHIRLEAAYNVRDLGGYPTVCGTKTRWRSLMRADALHELTGKDVERLLSLGLRTVIDLRNESEVAAQPNVFAGHGNVRYHHISLFHGLAPAELMFRARGPIDLSERYIEAIENCGPALVSVAQAIAEAEEGMVLFNCTAGKDRTGIVAAMILSVANVDPDLIAEDYALTGEIAAPLMQRLKERAIQRGLEDEMAARLLSSERTAMKALLHHMNIAHEGFGNYLGRQLANFDIITQLQKRILAHPAGLH
ncbi:tyrosine-protein phosphatase [Chelativorans sp. Marseille-P2723]|uniref:tyrosine-protein phosphatase n=1 Tax=Chelativorans sp. Marseille-P2723 TaxID=2709133 RepID=UPI00156F8754|nr:tyrosine-protein phosphatase [Chelativorans sp. Marseille-P2723]